MHKCSILFLVCLIGTGSTLAMNNKFLKGFAAVPPLYTFKLLWDKTGKSNGNSKPKTVPTCIKPTPEQQRFASFMQAQQDY